MIWKFHNPSGIPLKPGTYSTQLREVKIIVDEDGIAQYEAFLGIPIKVVMNKTQHTVPTKKLIIPIWDGMTSKELKDELDVIPDNATLTTRGDYRLTYTINKEGQI